MSCFKMFCCWIKKNGRILQIIISVEVFHSHRLLFFLYDIAEYWKYIELCSFQYLGCHDCDRIMTYGSWIMQPVYHYYSCGTVALYGPFFFFGGP